MKQKNKSRTWLSIIEVIVFMLLLTSVFEFAKQVFGANFDQFQWQVFTVVFATLAAVVVAYAVMRRHIRQNKQLLAEVNWLKKMEKDLRDKIDELTHFKDLVVWWEKRIDTLQEEMDRMKEEMKKQQEGE